MIQANTVFPSVDYTAHPAFRSFTAAPPTARDAAIDAALRRADTALEEIRGAGKWLPTAELETQYQRNVQPTLDELGRLCQEGIPADGVLAKVVRDALADSSGQLLKESLFDNEKYRFRPLGRATAAAERVARDLADEGLALCRMPDSVVRAIYDDVGQYRERLLEMSTTNGGTNCALALPLASRYWKEVAAFLKESGLLDGCSHYRREPLEPIYCALVLSHPGEKWWRGCYEDVGIATSRAVYMHNDKDYDMMKILVYLDEVDEKRGPFHFIRGSHKWQRSRTQSYFFKALDHAFNSNLAAREPVRTVYYRKVFRHAEFREQFVKLPQALRGSSHFGDDLLDGSPLGDWLLAQESVITSDVANCMAFIGADGIHRGGCVQEGRRWAFQLGLMKIPPLPRRIERGAKAAYGLARSKLRGAVRRALGDRGIAAARSAVKRIAGR